MSTPRFLTLPPGVRRVDLPTARGTFAALEALPTAGHCEWMPAVLVPGLPGSKEDFIAILQSLAQAGRRIIAIDQRGQYETPGPDDPAAYTREALGEDVGAVLDALEAEQVHLLGHSFGGIVTRETVLARAADPLIASHTLMSTGPASITGAREDSARQLLAAYPEMGLERIWDLVMEPEAVAAGVPPDIVAFLRKRMFSNTEAALVTMAQEVLTTPDRIAELAKTPTPHLVLYGEDDDGWTPAAQAEMAERLDAPKVVIPGAVHSPAVEAPETTASALTDFWNHAEAAGRR